MKITRTKTTCYEEEVPKTLDDFREWTFSSGGTAGEDFKIFARKFKSFVKKQLPLTCSLVSFSSGHYFLSGFITKNSKYVYFSTSDVRYFPGKWASDILIRTAKDSKDYTGGCNNTTTIKNFVVAVNNLLSNS